MVTVFIETGDGRDPVSSHPVHPPCCHCRIVLHVHFQDHLQTNFEVFCFLGEGLCSSCTDLEIVGYVHSHLFFTPFSLQLPCSCIPFSGTCTSYLVILKCFFSLLSFLKGTAQLGRATLADTSSLSNII